MKPAAFLGMLLLLSATASAQLTLLPQIGFDRSKTTVHYNDEFPFAPDGINTFFRGNIRLDYKFKGGHSPYLSVGTNPAPVELSFTNPSTAKTDYTAITGSSLWRLEAGYMFTSKAIKLGKSSKSGSTTSNTPKAATPKTESRSSCGSYYRSQCGSYNRCGSKAKKAPAKQASNMTLRIQPSVGIAYLPSIPDDIIIKDNGYQYNAGNYKTAFVSGLGFELGKGKQRIMTLSLSYTIGMGNLDQKTITQIEGGKQVINHFSSNTSSWGMTLGVPITLTKAHQKQVVKKEQKLSCQERYRCQSRCTKRF